MTLAQVLQLINSNIIPNNNNEITANVLRPILVEMLQQPNDLIGLLSNLTTSENTNLVGAINELKSDIDQLNNISIFQGTGNPNLNTSLNPNIADFYSQLSVGNTPIDLWIYNGIEWVSLNMNYVSFENVQPLTPTQQQTARDNIAALGTADLDGFVYDVTYNSTNHQITFYSQNEPNIVIDLPIEQLIKGVQLVGDDLVFTFEDGSTVTVPLNSLLVGVVKSVNGLTPNSQGAIILNITDIPGLSSALADFVKKDGSVVMTGSIKTVAVKLKSSSVNANSRYWHFEPDYNNFGDIYIYSTDINDQNVRTEVVMANGNLGIGKTPAAKLDVNGVVACSDGVANNNAATVGQLSSSLVGYATQSWVTSQGYLTSVSWSQVTGKPTTFTPSAHTHIINDVTGLQSELNNKSNTNGSNTTGGSWKIDYILSDVLSTAVGNGTIIFAQSNGTIDYGSSFVVYHRFQCSNINGLKIGVDNVGTGEVWHQFNFDPNSKADVTYVNSQVATVSGSIPTNNNQLINGAGYITSAALSGYVTQASLTTQLNDKVDKVAGKQLSTEDYTSAEKTKLSGIAAGAEVNVNADWNATTGDAQILNKPTIPTNNNQLTNGAGYQNASQVTAIVNSAVSGIPSPNNGTITYTGVGSITGGGTSSANQSNNTNYNFDLTSQTKSDIAVGVNAGSLFGGLSTYFKDMDVSSGGNFSTNEAFFNLFDPRLSGPTVNVEDHDVDGARLVLQSHLGGGMATYNGNFIYQNNSVGTIPLENGQKAEFVWSENSGRWKEVL